MTKKNSSKNAPPSVSLPVARIENLLNALRPPNLSGIAMSVKFVLWYAWLALVEAMRSIATYSESSKNAAPQQPKDYAVKQKRFGFKGKGK